MADLSRDDPLTRFTGLAAGYSRHRPDYPDAALDFLVVRTGLDSSSLLVDVGSGTGISSRLLAGRGIPVVGVEPNDDMRARAEREAVPPGHPVPSYRAGRAEATGLLDSCADVVLAAQSFHWFDASAALAEFHRILRPGGYAAILGYERDEADSFTSAYGAILRRGTDAERVEGVRRRAPEALALSPLFESAERHTFAHEQTLDRDGLLGRAFSVSYAPRETEAARDFAAALEQLFEEWRNNGTVILRYEVAIHLARRREVVMRP